MPSFNDIDKIITDGLTISTFTSFINEDVNACHAALLVFKIVMGLSTNSGTKSMSDGTLLNHLIGYFIFALRSFF